MLAQVSKLALSLGLMALLFVAALENHWFARGGDVLGKLTAPRDAAIVATQTPPSDNRPAPVPRAASHSGFGLVELAPNRLGQYETDVEIDGTPIHALVDTGATYVALRAEDARALNIDLPESAFNIRTQTANGPSMVAHVRLREVRVGDISVYNVDALVARPGALSVNLLGMSFLKKLESFQVADGRFVMKQ